MLVHLKQKKILAFVFPMEMLCVSPVSVRCASFVSHCFQHMHSSHIGTAV